MVWESCKKREAVFYYEKPDNVASREIPISIYYKYEDKLYCKGSFSSVEVSKESCNGKFTYYFTSGNVMCEGEYQNGDKTGYWKIYYKEGGVEREGLYKDGTKIGLWLNYAQGKTIADTTLHYGPDYTGEAIQKNKNGSIREKAWYVNGTYHGKYENYNSTGGLLYTGNYDDGLKINEWVFYHSENIVAAKVYYGKNETIDSVFFFNEDGSISTEQIDTATICKHPEMSDNIRQSIIVNNLIYPAVAIENAIQGQVLVQFTVRSDGSIDNVKCINDIKLDFGLEEECIRVVKTNFKFKPHKICNVKTAIRYNMPIKFRLR